MKQQSPPKKQKPEADINRKTKEIGTANENEDQPEALGNCVLWSPNQLRTFLENNGYYNKSEYSSPSLSFSPPKAWPATGKGDQLESKEDKIVRSGFTPPFSPLEECQTFNGSIYEDSGYYSQSEWRPPSLSPPLQNRSVETAKILKPSDTSRAIQRRCMGETEDEEWEEEGVPEEEKVSEEEPQEKTSRRFIIFLCAIVVGICTFAIIIYVMGGISMVDHAVDLIDKFVRLKPEHRITCDEALQHPFLSSYNLSSSTSL